MYTVRRSLNNPLITPSGEHPWEARGTFNPCPIERGGDSYLLYRALGLPDPLAAHSGISTVGIVSASDKNRRQLIVPEEPWERYGCEDPRVTFFEGRYVIFYTALGGVPFGAGNIKVGVALSPNLKTIDERHLVTPFNAKAMTLFPERINGKITAILTVHTDEPPVRMAIVECEKLEELWDEKFWEKWHQEFTLHVLNPLRSDHDHAEVGAQPIKTKDGWLLIYSYMQEYFSGEEHRVAGIEAVLLDLKDPRVIVAKTKGPIMVPEEIYECYGFVPKTIFPSGASLQEDGRLDIYYGAADTVCAVASLYLPDLLDAMVPERRTMISSRAEENPILKPEGDHAWESKAVFNPAALEIDGTIHLLYRAMSADNTSVFGYAATEDGVQMIERLEKPVYVPRADFEMKRGPAGGNSGCEDPRLTRIGDIIYLAYTAYDGVHPPRAALSFISVDDFLAKRFERWSKPELITPDDVDDKDMCLLSEKINGRYMIFHRIGGQICADLIDSLDLGTRRVNRCIETLGPRPGMWDSAKVGVAGPPLKTEAGWLFIYHGISRTSGYRLGAALLDLKDPTIVLSRMVDPIFEPVESYELEGQEPRVVFSCGMVRRDDQLLLYYGGGDTVVGVAAFSVSTLLQILRPKALLQMP